MKHALHKLSGAMLHEALVTALNVAYEAYYAELEPMNRDQLKEHLRQRQIPMEPGSCADTLRQSALACHEYTVFPRGERLPLRHGQLWKFCEELIANQWITVGPVLEKDAMGLTGPDSHRVYRATGKFFEVFGDTPGEAVVRCYVAIIMLGLPTPGKPLEIDM